MSLWPIDRNLLHAKHWNSASASTQTPSNDDTLCWRQTLRLQRIADQHESGSLPKPSQQAQQQAASPKLKVHPDCRTVRELTVQGHEFPEKPRGFDSPIAPRDAPRDVQTQTPENQTRCMEEHQIPREEQSGLDAEVKQTHNTLENTDQDLAGRDLSEELTIPSLMKRIMDLEIELQCANRSFQRKLSSANWNISFQNNKIISLEAANQKLERSEAILAAINQTLRQRLDVMRMTIAELKQPGRGDIDDQSTSIKNPLQENMISKAKLEDSRPTAKSEPKNYQAIGLYNAPRRQRRNAMLLEQGLQPPTQGPRHGNTSISVPKCLS